jgi:hypothetical protein
MKKTRKILALITLTPAIALTTALGQPLITVDELGNGDFNGFPLQSFQSADPWSGTVTLTYRLPFPGEPGDVEIFEPNTAGTNQLSDVIRFDGNGNLYFFSEREPTDVPPVDPADVYQLPGPVPGLQLVQLLEVGPEGNNGLFYNPAGGFPGDNSAGAQYHFISDSSEVPQITTQPQSQAVNAGSNATFCVTAAGAAPLSYQWRFNGTNISAATNTCYTRTNAQLADVGSYTAVVTNSQGSVTSAVATLRILSIAWFTLDGGGGASTGSVFRVRGTLGQPDAGKMTGGAFALQGGFWGIVALQTPGAPLLTITRNSQPSTITVSWPSPSTGFNLQQNGDLKTSNWATPSETVTDNGTIKFIVVNPPSGNRFYRLFKP